MSRPPSHPRQQPRRRRDPERGAVAVSAYLFMLVMLGLLALSLNTGILMDTRTELQTGSDSASLAAAGSLDGTMDGIARARSVAASYSAQHRAFDETIAIDPDSDVIFGKWHLKASDCTDGDCFTEMVPSTTNVASINAVKVDNGRDGDSNSRITLPFGDFVGAATSTVTS
ncbi:MAG TPA: Tad domain-containing protein, partial [Polyangia bacterium]